VFSTPACRIRAQDHASSRSIAGFQTLLALGESALCDAVEEPVAAQVDLAVDDRR
jgi:hypothetical protein